MNETRIRGLLPAERTLGRELLCPQWVGSTNEELKTLALQGGKHGTVMLADGQGAGRGRMGRRFESPEGAGIYLSLLLRLTGEPAKAAQLTAWAAVAVCSALERCCGVRADIKWVNDLLLGGRKLCGILTELVMDGETPCAILGIGLNVNQSRTELAAVGLGEIATSLAAEGVTVARETLAAAILTEMEEMMGEFPHAEQKWLERYRALCITKNRPVTVLRGGEPHAAFALAVEDDFSLRVRMEDGHEERLTAGEVSVRGLMGYQ